MPYDKEVIDSLRAIVLKAIARQPIPKDLHLQHDDAGRLQFIANAKPCALTPLNSSQEDLLKQNFQMLSPAEFKTRLLEAQQRVLQCIVPLKEPAIEGQMSDFFNDLSSCNPNAEAIEKLFNTRLDVLFDPLDTPFEALKEQKEDELHGFQSGEVDADACMTQRHREKLQAIKQAHQQHDPKGIKLDP